MTELFEFAKAWFLGLGDKYGVDPLIFGSIYVGAIPLFTLSLAWLGRNYRDNRSIILPAFCAMGCFISAYLYVIVIGQNVPLWIYGIVILMIAYGIYSTYRKVRIRIKDFNQTPFSNE